jgi:hypothetical protein
LVRAPDDPSWNADQLAAVHAVDAYIELIGEFAADPPNADMTRLLDVATEPLYSKDVASIAYLVQIGRHFDFSDGPYLITISRIVGGEQTVNGVRQIKIGQCDADNPTAVIVDPDGSQPPDGLPRIQYLYTVQWVDEVAGWRVAEFRRLGDGAAMPC